VMVLSVVGVLITVFSGWYFATKQREGSEN